MKPTIYRRTISFIFLGTTILTISTMSLDAMTLFDRPADSVTDTSHGTAPNYPAAPNPPTVPTSPAIPIHSSGSSDDTALENPDWKTVESGAPVLLTGRVRRVGSALFQEIVITDAEGRDWYVDKTEQAAIEAYEQQVVTVRGVVRLREMTLANGKKLEDRRELTDLQVLE